MNQPKQTTSQINVDAYAPAEVVRRVETAGLAKVDMAILLTLALSVLAGADGVTIGGFAGNLVPVTLGNIVGGSVFVALVYWIINLRGK